MNCPGQAAASPALPVTPAPRCHVRQGTLGQIGPSPPLSVSSARAGGVGMGVRLSAGRTFMHALWSYAAHMPGPCRIRIWAGPWWHPRMAVRNFQRMSFPGPEFSCVTEQVHASSPHVALPGGLCARRANGAKRWLAPLVVDLGCGPAGEVARQRGEGGHLQPRQMWRCRKRPAGRTTGTGPGRWPLAPVPLPLSESGVEAGLQASRSAPAGHWRTVNRLAWAMPRGEVIRPRFGRRRPGNGRLAGFKVDPELRAPEPGVRRRSK